MDLFDQWDLYVLKTNLKLFQTPSLPLIIPSFSKHQSASTMCQEVCQEPGRQKGKPHSCLQGSPDCAGGGQTGYLMFTTHSGTGINGNRGSLRAPKRAPSPARLRVCKRGTEGFQEEVAGV